MVQCVHSKTIQQAIFTAQRYCTASAEYAGVILSVCRASPIKTPEYITKLFSRPCNNVILLFSRRKTRRSFNTVAVKIQMKLQYTQKSLRLWTNILLYLGHDTKHEHSYREMLIGSYM